MSSELLSTEALCRSFGGLKAVDNVSIQVHKGVIQGLIGPNGAGKTTFFNLVSGMIEPDCGRVLFKGEDITGMKPHRIASRGISRTFQTTKLFSNMTVRENIMVGRHTRSDSGYLSCMFHTPRNRTEEINIRSKADSILLKLDLSDTANAKPGNLPFGKQRYVEIARALATEPDLLLLDEPAAGLNMHETEELGDLIRRIRDMDITIFIVDHDMSLVMDISDTVVVLDRGSVLIHDDPRNVQKNPDVISVYLGESNA